ncbi:MAG: SLC13 family permease [Planctomycetaceae bacterium]
MDWKIAVTLSVLAAVVMALTWLRAAPDLVLLGALTLLLSAGILDPAAALSGFANEGLFTVAVLFVVADGLNRTGAIAFVGQRLLGQPQSTRRAQARIVIPAAVLSAFMNNTPVVALLLPVISDWAKKHRISVSHLLMPLSYAAILGGMCTLIGTSTTLVLNGLLIQSQQAHGMEPSGLAMFEIAWIGVPAMVCGIGYVLICAPWLLKERKPAMTELSDPREYTLEMIVDASSPLVGTTIESAGLRHLPGMYLMEIDRQGHVLPAVSSAAVLQANDRLVFVGIVESVIDLQKIPGLTPATDQLFKLDSPRSERCLIEAVVSNSCPFLRMTIREARFRSRYDAAVIAVARNGQRINRKIGDISLQAGDTLLLEGTTAFIEAQRNSRDFFLVSRVEGSAPPVHERAWISRLVLTLMVLSVASGLLTMLKAAMLAAGSMILTRCSRGSDARRSVDWSVLLVIGAGLGIGEAISRSGTARFLAENIVGLAGENPTFTLIVIYGITMVFTNLITAKAAAVLFFPIAVETAQQLGVSFLPFAVAVIMASAASFASSIGYQTNLMVAGPGGYRTSDYLRLGIPLSIIVWILTVVIAPLVWPFTALP